MIDSKSSSRNQLSGPIALEDSRFLQVRERVLKYGNHRKEYFSSCKDFEEIRKSKYSGCILLLGEISGLGAALDPTGR